MMSTMREDQPVNGWVPYNKRERESQENAVVFWEQQWITRPHLSLSRAVVILLPHVAGGLVLDKHVLYKIVPGRKIG